MTVTYIIPTLIRDTLINTIHSIFREDKNAKIIIRAGETTANARNSAIKQVDTDWIAFIDDDDYYLTGFLKELDVNFDIIVMRMNQYGQSIPRLNDNNLYPGNIGINFFIKTEFCRRINIEFESSMGEDWRFIERCLEFNPKIKITNEFYYIAPKQGNWKL